MRDSLPDRNQHRRSDPRIPCVEATSTADKVALRLAKNWSAVETASRASLSATHAFSVLFGVKPLTALTGLREQSRVPI